MKYTGRLFVEYNEQINNRHEHNKEAVLDGCKEVDEVLNDFKKYREIPGWIKADEGLSFMEFAKTDIKALAGHMETEFEKGNEDWIWVDIENVIPEVEYEGYELEAIDRMYNEAYECEDIPF